MTTLKLTAFTGEVPRLIPRLLPNNGAQFVQDVRLERGELKPYRISKQVYQNSSLPTARPSTIYWFDDEWLSWPFRVNAAPGPVTDDRLYYTGDGAPKMRTGGTNYDMKIVPPTGALTATASGTGSGDITTRLYVYTNVSQFGEESEPSPLSNDVDWQDGQTVTLSGFTASMGDRGATWQRIYRSQTSSSGDTTLYFIHQRAAGAGDYSDNVPPSEIGEPLPSLDWTQPPDNLAGLISAPNGIMVAFAGKDLYFSEPYHPSAWPQKYILTTDYPIVGLGAFGTSIVVLTEGHPYLLQGTAPENMLMDKMELNLPCINPDSIVDLGYTIAYISPDGIVVVSAGGARVVSDTLFTRSVWQNFAPENMVASQFNGRYMFGYDFFNAEGEHQQGIAIIDLTGKTPYLIRANEIPLAFHYNIANGQLYYLENQAVYEFDPVNGASKIGNWKSKEFVMPRPEHFGVILVEAEEVMTEAERQASAALIAEIVAENEALFASGDLGDSIAAHFVNEIDINGDLTRPVPFAAFPFIQASVYADKKLVATVKKANDPQRLPALTRGRIWEVEVATRTPVQEITLARTGRELGVV